MRIVQAAGWYFPDSLGGTEVYVRALAAWLVRAGHEVLIAAPDAGASMERRYLHDGVPVYRYPIPSTPTRDEARGLTTVRGAERFHDWMRAQKPDVVHVHTFVTGLGLAEVEAAADTGARTVVTTHSASLGYLCERGTLLRDGRSVCDGRVAPRVCAACVLERHGVPAQLAGVAAGLAASVPALVPRPGRVGTALDLERLIAERREAQARLLDRAHAFVVLSEWARQAVLAAGAPADRVHVNRLGVADQPSGWMRKPGPDQRPTARPIIVGYLGRAEAIKGLDDLVHAVLALPADVAIRLRAAVAATNDQERASLARLQEEARSDHRVAFEPVVPHERVPDLLAGLDVLCCPSRAVEGGPTVALEAYAVGTPVIGTAVPALTEIVPAAHDGALVPPGDRAALSALLASIAAAPARVDRWRRHMPAPRTFDSVGLDYLALYAP